MTPVVKEGLLALVWYGTEVSYQLHEQPPEEGPPPEFGSFDLGDELQRLDKHRIRVTIEDLGA